MLFKIPTPKAWCGPRRGTRGLRRRTRRRPKQKELEALRSERGGALLSELAVKCGGGAGHPGTQLAARAAADKRQLAEAAVAESQWRDRRIGGSLRRRWGACARWVVEVEALAQ